MKAKRTARDSSPSAPRGFGGLRRQIFATLNRTTGAVRWDGDPGEVLLALRRGGTRIATAAELTARIHEEDLSACARDWFRVAVGRETEFAFRWVEPGHDPVWVQVIAQPMGREPEPAEMGLWIANIGDLVDFLNARADARRNRAVESITSGITHELNNALTPVHGFIQLALMALGPGHPQAPDLETALRAAERCATVVSGLQQSGRKVLLEARRVTAEVFLDGLVRAGRGIASANPGVRLKVSIARGLPDLRMDPDRTRHALLNLLRMAADSMPDGGRLRIRASRPDKAEPAGPAFVRVDIVDGGPGLTPSEMDRIFEPFHAARSCPSSDGLSIPCAAGLAEQQGGRLEVHSIPGRGTEIRFFIPVFSAQAEVPAPGRARGRALVVDEDPYRRRRSAKALRDDCWEVDEAEALDLTRNGSAPAPDLLVLHPPRRLTPEDVRLRLTAAFPATRILVLCEPGQRMGGGIPTLPPPYAPKMLLARVRELTGY